MSALAPGSVDIPWIWRAYLARGFITNLTGLWKSGKTTLLGHLLQALDGQVGTFCGQPVTGAKVLVVTEEPEVLWAARRDELAIGDHVRIITRPFLRRADPREWARFIDYIALRVATKDYTLVVFDALPNLWPVHHENDAADVTSAITLLHALTTAGAAVLLVTHPAKNDAGEGRGTRGSGALPAFVDVLLEMRRYRGQRASDTRRTLTGYSRIFDETPPPVVLKFDRKYGYRVEGTRSDVRSKDRLAVIKPLLPRTPPGLTIGELFNRWPTNGPPRSGSKTLSRDLETAIKAGHARRTGEGKRGDPYRYWWAGTSATPDVVTDSSPQTPS